MGADNRNVLRVAVAMSGGVDSSVAAALLKKDGHEVQGFFMALAQPDLEEQLARVQKVAARLGIGVELVDLAEEFDKEVLEYFSQSYFQGKTPNPCVVCNSKIKFGRLLDLVTAKGFDCLATGHYARIVDDPAGGRRLFKGRDRKKDQSYFLCRLSQGQLSRIMLPHGEHRKDEVYGLAVELGLAGVHGPESQDVCFLKNTDVGGFLARRSKAAPGSGPVVNRGGEQIGSHEGIHNFTIGQRRGLGIPDSTPYYVVGLEPLANKVIVGKKEDLLADRLLVMAVNWISGRAPELPQEFDVKIRYRHQAARAVVAPEAEHKLSVRFAEPQESITPGQFAVFYQDDELLGNGEICG